MEWRGDFQRDGPGLRSAERGGRVPAPRQLRAAWKGVAEGVPVAGVSPPGGFVLSGLGGGGGKSEGQMAQISAS